MMKNIAIFVSGSGEAAERIVKLFNEGNRLKTVLVYADDSAEGITSRIRDAEVEMVHYPDREWLTKGSEIARMLREKEVRLIVLDEFSLAIPDEILEATEGEMIRVSSPELAPREVVAALEADLRKPRQAEEEVKVEEETKDVPPTPESEWADALKIQFTPPKVPLTPPEVPESNQINGIPQDNFDEPQYQQENINTDFPQDNFNTPSYPRFNSREQDRENNGPMPSTWLIWSILVTIFCCFIPGIIAIIFSSQVSTKYFAGDIEGARRASRVAEIWIIVSFVLGVISATLYLPFILLSN